MNALTYTSYKEHYELFSKIHGSIAVHSWLAGCFSIKRHHFTVKNLINSLKSW